MTDSERRCPVCDFKGRPRRLFGGYECMAPECRVVAFE